MRTACLRSLVTSPHFSKPLAQQDPCIMVRGIETQGLFALFYSRTVLMGGEIDCRHALMSSCAIKVVTYCVMGHFKLFIGLRNRVVPGRELCALGFLNPVSATQV